MFVVAREVFVERFYYVFRAMEVLAGFKVVKQEPEFYGWHTVADEDSFVFLVVCLHLLESFALVFVSSSDICIADADCNSSILQNLLDEFAHLSV